MAKGPNGRRSIPACAGEPITPSWAKRAMKVYPRVCGGTRHAPLKDLANVGLSPRVRGNRDDDGMRRGYRRSIPACAGEP